MASIRVNFKEEMADKFMADVEMNEELSETFMDMGGSTWVVDYDGDYSDVWQDTVNLLSIYGYRVGSCYTID